MAQLNLIYTTSGHLYKVTVNKKEVFVAEIENQYGVLIPGFFNYFTLAHLKEELAGKGVELEYDDNFDCF